MVSRRKSKKHKASRVKAAPSQVPATVVRPPVRSEVVTSFEGAPVFTYLDDGPLRTRLKMTDAYGQLVLVAMARAKFYGALLDAEYNKHRTGALFGDAEAISQTGEHYKTGEYITALVQLEAQERDRAERLVKDAIRIGLEARAVDLHRDQVRTMVEAVRNTARALGHEETDEIRRLMQRAIIEARQFVLADDPSR